MFNTHAKFELSTITCNEEMKGNARCKNSKAIVAKLLIDEGVYTSLPLLNSVVVGQNLTKFLHNVARSSQIFFEIGIVIFLISTPRRRMKVSWPTSPILRRRGSIVAKN